MCRSIKVLRRPEPPPVTPEEIRAAALQFIRKVSGFRQPSQANREAFERAVDEVAATTTKLLGVLPAARPPRPRPVVEMPAS